MFDTKTLLPFSLPRIAFDKEAEGGAGGGAGDTKDTGGDTGGEAQETGIAQADDQGAGEGEAQDTGTVLDGGTAEGQDNSDGEGDGETGDKDDKEGDGEEPVVPETYEFAAPEGMEIDQGLADAVSPVFKELGLTQEQANKLVGAYGEAMQAQSEAYAAAVKETVDGWVEAAKTDKEIGHNNWKSSVDAANAVIRKFGSKEFIQDVLVGQGIGNHPEMIRILSRIGKAVSDDTFMTGEQTDTQGDAPAENRWYGETTPLSKKG